MENKETLYIVIPAYNEEKNIESVVKGWYPMLVYGDKESKLVIADSGSLDQTHEVLLKLQKQYPQLEIMSDTRKEHGPKLVALYHYAISKNANYIFQTDADGQTNPDEFPAFWNERQNYDAVLGNRVKRGDGKFRKFVEVVLCLILRVIFGVKVKDANVPFRLMRANIVNLYIDRFQPDYNLTNSMLVVFFSYYNHTLLYKEITFKPRQAGINSVNFSRIIKIGTKAVLDFWNFRKNM